MRKIKTTITKKAELIYFLAFFCGILLANMLGSEQLKQYSIFNEYFLKQLSYVSVNYNDLFFYIAENRGIIFCLLFLFGITKFGMPVHFLYIIWNGFSFGIAMVSLIVNFGFKGILVLCVFLFPQYLFYIPLYFMLFYFSCHWADTRKNEKYRKPLFSKTVLAVCFLGSLILLFFIGIMTESYLNPYLIKKIIKIL